MVRKSRRMWLGQRARALACSVVLAATLHTTPSRAKGPSPQSPSLGHLVDRSVRPRGAWLGARVEFPNAYLDTEGFVVLPGLTVGYKWGRFVFAGVVDFAYGHDHRGEDPHYHWIVQHLFFSFGPVVEYLFLAAHSVELHAAGELLFRYTWKRRKTVDWDEVEEVPVEDTFGLLARSGVGGRYFFSGRLGLGADVGLVLTYAHKKTLQEDGHVSQIVSIGPFARLTLAVIW